MAENDSTLSSILVDGESTNKDSNSYNIQENYACSIALLLSC
jgi:hypothetical protein